MVRVLASGVFDIIHPGHISYLKQAKALGDELVVVIACDETVRKNKHEPITPQEMRAEIVSQLKPVDRVVIGGTGNIYDTVKTVKPDIIAIGHDFPIKEEELLNDLSKNGLTGIEIKRMSETADDLNATRRIVAKIRNGDSR